MEMIAALLREDRFSVADQLARAITEHSKWLPTPESCGEENEGAIRSQPASLQTQTENNSCFSTEEQNEYRPPGSSAKAT